MYQYKVVMVGESGVGKSALAQQYTANTFKDHNPTLGVHFSTKGLIINDTSIKLNISDTAGQERFRCSIPIYLRTANAAMAVFDVTNRDSFDKLGSWKEEIDKLDPQPIVKILVANKWDLKDRSACGSEEEIIQYAKKNRYNKVFFTDAQSQEDVKKLFEDTAQLLYDKDPTIIKKDDKSNENLVENTNKDNNNKNVIKNKENYFSAIWNTIRDVIKGAWDETFRPLPSDKLKGFVEYFLGYPKRGSTAEKVVYFATLGFLVYPIINIITALTEFPLRLIANALRNVAVRCVDTKIKILLLPALVLGLGFVIFSLAHALVRTITSPRNSYLAAKKWDEEAENSKFWRTLSVISSVIGIGALLLFVLPFAGAAVVAAPFVAKGGGAAAFSSFLGNIPLIGKLVGFVSTGLAKATTTIQIVAAALAMSPVVAGLLAGVRKIAQYAIRKRQEHKGARLRLIDDNDGNTEEHDNNENTKKNNDKVGVTSPSNNNQPNPPNSDSEHQDGTFSRTQSDQNQAQNIITNSIIFNDPSPPNNLSLQTNNENNDYFPPPPN